MSVAETRWPELLKILKFTVDGEANADVSNLKFPEKARLIQKDPVTCARYFQHRMKSVMKTWILIFSWWSKLLHQTVIYTAKLIQKL